MHRTEILKQAEELTSRDRNSQYGEPREQCGLAGELYELWLSSGGAKYGPAHNNAICMVLTKLSRIAVGEMGKIDSYVDGAGYLAIAGEMVSEDAP